MDPGQEYSQRMVTRAILGEDLDDPELMGGPAPQTNADVGAAIPKRRRTVEHNKAIADGKKRFEELKRASRPQAPQSQAPKSQAPIVPITGNRKAMMAQFRRMAADAMPGFIEAAQRQGLKKD